MKKSKKFFIIGIIFLILFAIYTVAVKKADVSAIGPNNSEVGFSKINLNFHNTFKYDETWYKITKYAGFFPFVFVAFYGFTGLMQLIKEKSLKKVDKKLILLGGLYCTVVIIYVFFEKFIINYRPIIMDGELEASYPSSHTLMAIAICMSAIMINKYIIKEKSSRMLFDIFATMLMLVIVIGRMISGVHWISDIFGSILISIGLLSFFKALLIKLENNGGV